MRGMMICCPMTSKIKGYVFEVVVEQILRAQSAPISSTAWTGVRAGAVRKRTVPPQILADVQAKIKALLGL
jgi:mRNA interferase MazF